MDLNNINRDPARLRTWVAYFVRMLQHRWWIYLDMLRRNSYTVYYRVFDTTISNGVGLACVCATKRMNSKDMRSHFVSYSSFVHGSMQCMYSYSNDCYFLYATFSFSSNNSCDCSLRMCDSNDEKREKNEHISTAPSNELNGNNSNAYLVLGRVDGVIFVAGDQIVCLFCHIFNINSSI